MTEPNSCPGELPGLVSFSLVLYLLEASAPPHPSFMGPSGVFLELKEKLSESRGPAGRFNTLWATSSSGYLQQSGQAAQQG